MLMQKNFVLNVIFFSLKEKELENDFEIKKLQPQQQLEL